MTRRGLGPLARAPGEPRVGHADSLAAKWTEDHNTLALPAASVVQRARSVRDLAAAPTPILAGAERANPISRRVPTRSGCPHDATGASPTGRGTLPRRPSTAVVTVP